MGYRLILFDVDGTLIWPGGAGREAVKRALREVYGVTGDVDRFPMAGKTDPLIVRGILRAAGLEEGRIEAGWSRFCQALPRHLAQTVREFSVTPLPGVLPLLTALSARREVVLGLLTGNLEETAPIKLRAAGIDPALFRVGAYGSDGADRRELARIALARARALLGREAGGEGGRRLLSVVVVGDTPADVEAGKAIGARTVAVSTGRPSPEELQAAGPDHLFPDLSDLPAVLAVLLGGG